MLGVLGLTRITISATSLGMGPEVHGKVVKLQFHANCNHLIRFCGVNAITSTRQPGEVGSLQAERASKIEL
jgi:hypothetical protein